MKLRFLDARNCHSLLPIGHGLATIQRLDECLNGINNSEQNKGAIDRLVEHNKKTFKLHKGNRFLKSPLDIAQSVFVADRLINTQAIERPNNGPPKLHLILQYQNQATWKAIVPLQFLLKGWGDANNGYQCYEHVITHNFPKTDSVEELNLFNAQDSEYYYTGITGRNWLVRFSEHMSEIHRGSRRKFYNAWRESLGLKNVFFISSLIYVNFTFEDAMKWEEITVDRLPQGPNCLNMIPGGFKGLKYLHEHRITDHIDITLEERDRAIEDYFRQNPRKGIPNPFMSELWEDDSFYLRVIEARDNTLSPNQVKEIRKLAEMGWSIEKITKEVNALNERQVKNVISGKTYKRIH